MLCGYCRLLMPDQTGISLIPHRIVQNVSQVLKALTFVRQTNGCILEEKKVRTGRRHENGKKNENWGGSCKKNKQIDYSPPDDNVYGDLREVVQGSNDQSVMTSHSDASTVTLLSIFCAYGV